MASAFLSGFFLTTESESFITSLSFYLECISSLCFMYALMQFGKHVMAKFLPKSDSDPKELERQILEARAKYLAE